VAALAVRVVVEAARQDHDARVRRGRRERRRERLREAHAHARTAPSGAAVASFEWRREASNSDEIEGSGSNVIAERDERW
jgi:hypothetical protein